MLYYDWFYLLEMIYKMNEPCRKCDRAHSEELSDGYIRALLPYDFLSCNGRHHQYVLFIIAFIVFFLLFLSF